MRILGILFAGLALIATPASASDHICWVASVIMREKGIAIKFVRGGPDTFSITNSIGTTSYRHIGDTYQPIDDHFQPIGKPLEFVPMDVGDTFFGWTGAESTCNATIVVQNDKIGFLASTPPMPVYIPGEIPLGPKQEFIPAEKAEMPN